MISLSYLILLKFENLFFAYMCRFDACISCKLTRINGLLINIYSYDNKLIQCTHLLVAILVVITAVFVSAPLDYPFGKKVIFNVWLYPCLYK